MKLSLMIAAVSTATASAEWNFFNALTKRTPRGSSYCTWAPDDDCFESGWPQCCQDEDQPCPPAQPRCDIADPGITGWNYCTWGPDEECYPSSGGRPPCCNRFGGTNCPTDKPNCEANVNRREPRGGQDFCTWAPDDTCFESGWPQCCDEELNQPCPEAQPRCDIGAPGETGWNYCTWSPDEECWPSSDGRPPCCDRFGGTNCPTAVPNCEAENVDGQSYCDWAPDDDCFEDGWPQCCEEEDQPCPEAQPRCDFGNPGWDYCARGPDNDCWPSSGGRPPCCDRFGGTNCPTDTPNCEVQEEAAFLRNH